VPLSAPRFFSPKLLLPQSRTAKNNERTTAQASELTAAPSASAAPPQADINAATSVDLQQLEDIGPASASIIMSGQPYVCGRALKAQLMDKKGSAHGQEPHSLYSLSDSLADKVVEAFEVRGCGNGEGNNGYGVDCEEWRASRRRTPGGADGWTTCAKEAEDDNAQSSA
jgi:hypothetical protein